MQVNRLNHLSFPPATPSAAGGLLDAQAQDDAIGADATAAANTSRASRAAPAPKTLAPTLESVAEASVKLELNTSQRAQAAVTYGPDGMFAGKSSVEVATTPAERFVASAVDIMRTYQQEHPQPAASGALDRLKQAVVSRFSAQA